MRKFLKILKKSLTKSSVKDFLILNFLFLSYTVYKGRNHVKALADKTAQRKIENVVEYPRRRHIGYLEISYVAGVSNIHKYTHNNKCREGKSHKEYLPGRGVQNN